jgi:uncharacterized protein (UPF0335 family)
MILSNEEQQQLKGFVTSYARLEAEIKANRAEQKHLGEKCWEACGIQAKVLKKLAKESTWDHIERLAQAQLEEQLEQGRHALGLLADLPLGRHALQETAKRCGAATAFQSEKG